MGEREIKDLNPGQSAWTVPWGLHEAQGKKWLHPNYSAHTSPGGTVDMKITALAPKGAQHDRYFVHTGKSGVIVGLAPFGGPRRGAMNEKRPFKKRDECCSDCQPSDDVDQPSDRVDHETWIEYHDRLVKEYYDFDAEWALIKEICPELDRPTPEPTSRRVRRVRRARPYRESRLHPLHGVAVAQLGVAVLNYTLGNIVTMAVWAIAAVFMLLAATMATARR